MSFYHHIPWYLEQPHPCHKSSPAQRTSSTHPFSYSAQTQSQPPHVNMSLTELKTKGTCIWQDLHFHKVSKIHVAMQVSPVSG